MLEHKDITSAEYVSIQDLMKWANRSRTSIVNKVSELVSETDIIREGNKKLIPIRYVKRILDAFPSQTDTSSNDTDTENESGSEELKQLLSYVIELNNTVKEQSDRISELEKTIESLQTSMNDKRDDTISELLKRLSESNSVLMQAQINQSKTGFFKRLFHGSEDHSFRA